MADLAPSSTQTVVDPFAEVGRFARFRMGFRYPFRGALFLLKNPRLLPWALLPVMLSMLAIAAATITVSTGFPVVLKMIWVPAAAAPLWQHIAWYGAAISVGFGAFLASCAFAYLTIGIVAIPFNDVLSERVEFMVLGAYSEAFSWRILARDLATSALHSVGSFMLWLFCMMGLLLLNLIPALGSVLNVVLGLMVSGFFLSREMMDGCMSRRRIGFRHKLRIVRSDLPLIQGFGTATWLLLWVPFLNFLTFPFAVVGGTLLFCDLERLGRIPDATGKLGFQAIRRGS